jgi:multicomponent Na+:H+ antiporter subunit G
MPSLTECVVALALVTGTFFTSVACIGLLRFPDVFCRMHAAGKAGTLGVSLILVGIGIFFAAVQPSVPLRAAAAVFFQFLTTPAATHLLARASYLAKYPLAERTALDELQTYLPSRPHDTYGHE